jgi:hypothetical protein
MAACELNPATVSEARAIARVGPGASDPGYAVVFSSAT